MSVLPNLILLMSKDWMYNTEMDSCNGNDDLKPS